MVGLTEAVAENVYREEILGRLSKLLNVDGVEPVSGQEKGGNVREFVLTVRANRQTRNTIAALEKLTVDGALTGR